MADHAYSDRRQAGARSGPGPSGNDPNYYQLLGVTFGATSDEIRRAYRAAMKETHPDRQQAAARARAEDQARLLNRAYATLSKPESRRQYDQTIRTQVMQDELMSRYTGGFVEQWQSREAQQFDQTLTEADRREQARGTRQAMLTLLTVFVVLTAIFVLLVVLYGLGQAVVNAIF